MKEPPTSSLQAIVLAAAASTLRPTFDKAATALEQGTSMNIAFFIDHQGDIQDSHAHSLRRQTGTTLSDSRLTEFVVRNMGWVAIKRLANEGVQITCVPGQLSEATLAGLLRQIWELQAVAFVIEDLSIASQPFKFMPDPATATRYLAAIVEQSKHGSASDQPRFLKQATPLYLSPFAAAIDAAEDMISSATAITGLSSGLNILFDGRWSLYRAGVNGNLSAVVAVGRGYTPFNLAWGRSDREQTVFDYADVAFGEWVARSHQEIILVGGPLCEEIDAFVEFPDVGCVHLRYCRLLLLVKGSFLGDLILSAAVSDDLIDLRRRGRQKTG